MSTGSWSGIIDEAATLYWFVCAWNDLGYGGPPAPASKRIPPPGERSAHAIRSGHEAVQQIDKIISELHQLRGQLITEIRADQDARAKRIDKMLAERPPGPELQQG